MADARPGGDGAPQRATLQPVQAADIDALFALETDGFPPDEAASRDAMAYRARAAPAYFWKAVDGATGEAFGFVCGTRFRGAQLTHDSMEEHVPDGDSLGVHSVVVAAGRRRRGLAVWMLGEYVRAVAEAQRSVAASDGAGGAGGGSAAPVERLALICKEGLIELYRKAGFRLVGPSPVVHGKDPWFEMQRDVAKDEGQRLPIFQVDAFTDRPFGGNPAGVFVLPRPVSEAAKAAAADDLDAMPSAFAQSLASEMNVAETAFIARRDDGVFNLRWFTPAVEVDLCGHATLASTHVLYAEGLVPKCQEEVKFHTRSGMLTCRRSADGSRLEMNFPADPVAPLEGEEAAATRATLATALQLPPEALLSIGRGKFDVIVELSRADFGRIVPSIDKIREVKARGVIVTAAGEAGDEADVVSRFFAPLCGVDEDPVTGSAHCTLASFWTPKLAPEGPKPLRAYQMSSRGGRLEIELVGDGGSRVALRGVAVTTLSARLAPAATAALLEY